MCQKKTTTVTNKLTITISKWLSCSQPFGDWDYSGSETISYVWAVTHAGLHTGHPIPSKLYLSRPESFLEPSSTTHSFSKTRHFLYVQSTYTDSVLPCEVSGVTTRLSNLLNEHYLNYNVKIHVKILKYKIFSLGGMVGGKCRQL